VFSWKLWSQLSWKFSAPPLQIKPVLLPLINKAMKCDIFCVSYLQSFSWIIVPQPSTFEPFISNKRPSHVHAFLGMVCNQSCTCLGTHLSYLQLRSAIYTCSMPHIKTLHYILLYVSIKIMKHKWPGTRNLSRGEEFWNLQTWKLSAFPAISHNNFV
jgi:hypothetical protein